MHGSYERQVAEHRKIQRRILRGTDKIVAPPPWADWARSKHCWPEKTATHLASIAGRDPRTAERWLSGEFEPPLAVVGELIKRMFPQKS